MIYAKIYCASDSDKKGGVPVKTQEQNSLADLQWRNWTKDIDKAAHLPIGNKKKTGSEKRSLRKTLLR